MKKACHVNCLIPKINNKTQIVEIMPPDIENLVDKPDKSDILDA